MISLPLEGKVSAKLTDEVYSRHNNHIIEIRKESKEKWQKTRNK